MSYTNEGVKGLKAEGGSARVAAAGQVVEGMGGKVDAFYFAFGGADAYVIADFDDNVSAAAVSLAVGAGGEARIRTVVLLTAEEADAAASRQAAYRPPGH